MSKNVKTLADLTSDPNNARKHNARNVGVIADALQEVGAARSIVIDENGVVLAGNATVDAAAEVGMENVIVVDAPGDAIVAVRRTNLTERQKTRLALLDNRAAELAGWDQDVLAAIAEQDETILRGGWYDEEVAAIRGLVEDDGDRARIDIGGALDKADPHDGKVKIIEGDNRREAPLGLLRIGRHDVPINDAEMVCLHHLVREYYDERGSLYGFVRSLLVRAGIDFDTLSNTPVVKK